MAFIRIGALISGGGSNLQAILDAADRGTIDARVVFVGSDTPDAPGLDRSRKRNIPTFVVDYGRIIRSFRNDPGRFQSPPDADLMDIAARQSLAPPKEEPEKVIRFLTPRISAESLLLKHMADYPFDLLVLAGFMRTLTPYFIDRVNTDPARPRIMNIHPALLPAFPGLDGYGDTYRHGCKIGGCTVHFVDYGEDTGPIIGQKAFAIDSQDTLEDVRKKGLALEWVLYPECIRLFAEGRLCIVRRDLPAKDGRSLHRTVVEISPRKNVNP